MAVKEKRASSGARPGAGRQRQPAQRAAGMTKKPKEPSPLDRLKLQVAEDLGLGEKVRQQGWAMLTAAESGRVGGVLNRKLKEMGLVIGPKGSLLQAQQSGAARA